jgi:hypothetical protein
MQKLCNISSSKLFLIHDNNYKQLAETPKKHVNQIVETIHKSIKLFLIFIILFGFMREQKGLI